MISDSTKNKEKIKLERPSCADSTSNISTRMLEPLCRRVRLDHSLTLDLYVNICMLIYLLLIFYWSRQKKLSLHKCEFKFLFYFIFFTNVLLVWARLTIRLSHTRLAIYLNCLYAELKMNVKEFELKYITRVWALKA